MKKNTKILAFMLALAGIIGCGNKVSVPTNTPVNGGSVKLLVVAVANVNSVNVTISGAGLATPIQSVLQKVAGTETFQGLFENIPAGSPYTVSVQGNTVTDLYVGSKTGLTVVAGQTTNVTIYLQKQGNIDQTAPVITSVTYVSASGNTFFNPLESGTISVATRFADVFAWSATGGTFVATNTATVVYTAPAVVGSDTVTILVTNSANGKTATASVVISVVAATGALDVTASFAPEITDVSANPGSFQNTNGEVMTLTAVTDPDITTSTTFSFLWTTTCNGITLNGGSSAAVFSFSFTGANAAPADCLATVVLQEKDANGVLVGLPFSQVTYRLAYVPAI